MNNYRRIACAFAACIVMSGRAWGAPSDVCALLTPFFAGPPAHFDELRGTKTGDKTWASKANPQADSLNATCNFSAYVAHRIDFDCTTRFDVDAIYDQQAFYNDAIAGIDYCMGSLTFGTRVRRSTDHSDDGVHGSDAVNWYRTNVKEGQDIAEFGVGVGKRYYKDTKTRDVTITLYYEAQ